MLFLYTVRLWIPTLEISKLRMMSLLTATAHLPAQSCDPQSTYQTKNNFKFDIEFLRNDILICTVFYNLINYTLKVKT